MRTKIIFLLVFFWNNIHAQNPAIIWENTIGGNQIENTTQTIFNSSDSSLFTLGYSNSGAGFDKSDTSRGLDDLWLIKYTKNGVILWEKTFGGSNYDFSEDMLIFQNQIYVLSSSNSDSTGDKTTSSFGFRDYWLLCLDLNGNLLWQTSYGGVDNERAKSVTLLNNGNLLLTGSSSSGVSGNKSEPTRGLIDVWILEVSPLNGSIVQQKTIGTSDYDAITGVAQDAQNNLYLLCAGPSLADGDKTIVGFGVTDCWLVKLNTNFQITEQRCFGGDSFDNNIFPFYESEMLLYTDGFLYLLSASQSDPSGNKTAPRYDMGSFRDFWLVKLDMNLNIVWDKSYGGSNTDDPFSIKKVLNDKLVIVGESGSIASGNKTSSNFGVTSIWYLLLDFDGNIIMQESYGAASISNKRTNFPSIAEDFTGALYIACTSDSDASGMKSENVIGNTNNSDFWILKIDASASLSVEEELTSLQLNPFPNPFHYEIVFNLHEAKGKLLCSFYSEEGKLISEELIDPKITPVFNWAPKQKGVFYYRFKGENELFTGKVIAVE